MPVNLICVHCGEFFAVSPSRLGSRRYCSRECYNAEKRPDKEAKPCEYCGEEFESLPSESRKFCSRECYYNHQRGGEESNGHQGNGESPDGCHHLAEYRSEDGECVRCDMARFARDDQTVKRELTADAHTGRVV